jgi:hypothetical protein
LSPGTGWSGPSSCSGDLAQAIEVRICVSLVDDIA